MHNDFLQFHLPINRNRQSGNNLSLFVPSTHLSLIRARFLALLVVAGLVSLSGMTTNASAQSAEAVNVISWSAESQFPEGLTFKLVVESDLRLDDVRVTFEIGDRGSTQYAYLELDQTTRPLINGELFHRTNSRGR
jgi:hypothetical protein